MRDNDMLEQTMSEPFVHLDAALFVEEEMGAVVSVRFSQHVCTCSTGQRVSSEHQSYHGDGSHVIRWPVRHDKLRTGCASFYLFGNGLIAMPASSCGKVSIVCIHQDVQHVWGLHFQLSCEYMTCNDMYDMCDTTETKYSWHDHFILSYSSTAMMAIEMHHNKYWHIQIKLP